jgi:hypothetical protein
VSLEDELRTLTVNPDALARNGHRPGVVRVSDVKPEKVSWLWRGRLPAGKLVVVDGDPALGKSTLMLDWAARITTGTPWPDGDIPAIGNVVLLSAEDGIADTIRPRLDAAGADASRVVVLDHVPTFDDEGNPGPPRPPSLPGDLDLIEQIVNEERAAYVAVDVLSAFLSGKVDSYRDQDVRGALMPLARMAERTGACVAVLRHLAKNGGGNPLYRGGGSIGIIGAARAAMLVAPDPEDETRRIVAMTKSNLAAIPPALAFRLVSDELHGCGRITWEGETAHRAVDLLAFQTDDERTAGDDAAEFLTELLHDGPLPAAEVKALGRKQGIAERTLDRARKRAGVTTQRNGFGKGAVYLWRILSSSPPNDHAGHGCQHSEPGEHGAHEWSGGEHARVQEEE